MTTRMRRPPAVDAEWIERGQIYLALIDRAGKRPSVLAARDRAAVAMDRLLDVDDGETVVPLLAFLRSLRALARGYVQAVPALSEIAYPAGSINRSEVGLLPAQLTYFVAPFASIGLLAVLIVRDLLRRRIERDNAAVAMILSDELERQMSFTTPHLYKPRPLAELRALAEVKRGRGRPAGRSASTVGWTDVPKSGAELAQLVRGAVVAQRAAGLVVTPQAVAARLGIDDRRLREALRHHGIRLRPLLTQIERELSEKKTKKAE